METSKIRKWIVIAILAVLVIVLPGLSLPPQAAFAQQATPTPQTGQQQNQAETLFLGNVGVFSPYGFNEDTFSITKVDKRSLGSQPVNFIMPLVRVTSTHGNFPNVLTYVFFNVRSGSIERRGAAEAIGIWFRSNNGGSWQRCANMLIINDRTSTQMGMDFNLRGRGETRIACVATQYNALYGVGFLQDRGRNVERQ